MWGGEGEGGGEEGGGGGGGEGGGGGGGESDGGKRREISEGGDSAPNTPTTRESKIFFGHLCRLSNSPTRYMEEILIDRPVYQ